MCCRLALVAAAGTVAATGAVLYPDPISPDAGIQLLVLEPTDDPADATASGAGGIGGGEPLAGPHRPQLVGAVPAGGDQLSRLSRGKQVAEERAAREAAELAAQQAAQEAAQRAAQEAAQKAAQRAAEQAARDAAAREAEARRPRFVRPAVGRLTSGYGARWGTMHAGIDIANRIGTPILSVADGVVVESGPASGFGLWVRVRHGDGTITVYGHVDRSLVRTGQAVRGGQQIATMGNRGDSTGPHLHFEVWASAGAKVNPLSWLRARAVAI